MTIQQIIDSVSELKGRQPDAELLIRHINTLENRIKKNIVDKFVDRDEYPFEHYAATDYNSDVLAPEPYTDVYIWYLIYMIDVRAGNDNQQVSRSHYEQSYSELAAYWTREHMPFTSKKCHSGCFGI